MTAAKPLDGRVALVTGGAAGIGRETARALAGAGAAVGIVDLNAEGALEASAEIQAATGAATAWAKADVADEGQATAAHRAITAALGPVTVLINNAGIMPQLVAPLDQQPIRHYDEMLAIHVRSAVLFSALCLPAMRAARFGRIVSLSSVLGLVGLPYRAGYSIAKHAINGLTRSLAVETARFGITVNAVAPGYIATKTNRDRAAAGMLDFDLYAERTPVGRWGEPAEIARVILFLADPASAYITGAIIPVDGGFTVRGDPGEDLTRS